jgi:hypothetical protein
MNVNYDLNNFLYSRLSNPAFKSNQGINKKKLQGKKIWSKEEGLKLLRVCMKEIKQPNMSSSEKWNSISQKFPGKTADQCSEKYKYMMKLQKIAAFTLASLYEKAQIELSNQSNDALGVSSETFDAIVLS